MVRKFGKQNPKYKREGKPRSHALYKIWFLQQLDSGYIKSVSFYSFHNRNNPKLAYSYSLRINERIKNLGYAWIIDNQAKILLEVFDLNVWRQPTTGELIKFEENRN
jgi:hypothetical protein